MSVSISANDGVSGYEKFNTRDGYVSVKAMMSVEQEATWIRRESIFGIKLRQLL